MATVFGGTTSERFGFIERFGKDLGVRYRCEWLGVSRSGYYDWQKREPSRRQKQDIELLDNIRTAHRESREAYGSPRIYLALKENGTKAGRHRIARLMRENGIRGRVVTVTQRRPKLKLFQQSGENLRLKLPAPTAKDQQWVADLTYSAPILGRRLDDAA